MANCSTDSDNPRRSQSDYHPSWTLCSVGSEGALLLLAFRSAAGRAFPLPARVSRCGRPGLPASGSRFAVRQARPSRFRFPFPQRGAGPSPFPLAFRNAADQAFPLPAHVSRCGRLGLPASGSRFRSAVGRAFSLPARVSRCGRTGLPASSSRFAVRQAGPSRFQLTFRSAAGPAFSLPVRFAIRLAGPPPTARILRYGRPGLLPSRSRFAVRQDKPSHFRLAFRGAAGQTFPLPARVSQRGRPGFPASGSRFAAR